MKRAMVVLVVLGVAVLVALALRLSPIRHHWYTDADTIREAVSTAEIREILWQLPRRVPGGLRTDADEYEPKLSADGLTMFFVRGKAGAGAAIHTSRFDVNTGWSEPERLSEVGLEADELGPEPSADGTSLYFYSNRDGGFGGYDLWVRRRNGDKWGEANNLGPAVNTPFNDYGPALTPDGKSLYFASNRPPLNEDHGPDPNAWPATIREDLFHRTYDLYAARVSESGVMEASPMTALNTPFNEGAPAVSGFGDFLYFASDRPGGEGGFDLYRARRVGADLRPAENLGASLNTSANELDPALGLGGFRLYFSSDRPSGDAVGRGNELEGAVLSVDAGSAARHDAKGLSTEAPRGLKPAARSDVGSRDARGVANPHRTYDIFVSTSREVFRVMESERRPPLDWAAFVDDVGIPLLWLLLALLALLTLLALMRGMRQRRMSLLARCLLASLLAHLALMVLLTLWNVGTAVMEGVRRGGSIRVALASPSMDGLQGQIRGSFAELPAPEAESVEYAIPRLPVPVISGIPLVAVAPQTTRRDEPVPMLDPPAPTEVPAPGAPAPGVSLDVAPASSIPPPSWNLPAKTPPSQETTAFEARPRPQIAPARPVPRGTELAAVEVRAIEPPRDVSTRVAERSLVDAGKETAASAPADVDWVTVPDVGPAAESRVGSAARDVALPPLAKATSLPDGGGDFVPHADTRRPERLSAAESPIAASVLTIRRVEPVASEPERRSMVEDFSLGDVASVSAEFTPRGAAPVLAAPVGGERVAGGGGDVAEWRLPREETVRSGESEEPGSDAHRRFEEGVRTARPSTVFAGDTTETLRVELAVAVVSGEPAELSAELQTPELDFKPATVVPAPIQVAPVVVMDAPARHVMTSRLPPLDERGGAMAAPEDSNAASFMEPATPPIASRPSVSHLTGNSSASPSPGRFDLAPPRAQADMVGVAPMSAGDVKSARSLPAPALSPVHDTPAEAAASRTLAVPPLALPNAEAALDRQAESRSEREELNRARVGDGASQAGQGWIYGRVMDAARGDALTNAEVRLERADAPAIVSMTDDEGRYELKVEDVPDHFALSASLEGFVPSSVDVARDVLMAASTHIDFRLRRMTQSIVVIEESPRVHHLGDDRFDGPINSQFQQSSEGTVFTAEFELTDEQAPPNIRRAELTLMVKGVQRRHSIVVNGTRLSRRLDHAPEDGSFGEFRVAFDAALLRPGSNTIDVVAAPSDTDVDDFEFVNLQVHLTP